VDCIDTEMLYCDIQRIYRPTDRQTENHRRAYPTKNYGDFMKYNLYIFMFMKILHGYNIIYFYVPYN